MNKDQTIGAVILIVCVLVAVFYVVTLAYPNWLSMVGIQATSSTIGVQFWVIAIPVAIGFIGILTIGAWIGWTMATTPPPKPIDDITVEAGKESKEPKETR